MFSFLLGLAGKICGQTEKRCVKFGPFCVIPYENPPDVGALQTSWYQSFGGDAYMFGLSEEEQVALAAARAAAQAAKSIIDRLERKSREAHLEELLERKRLSRRDSPAIQSEDTPLRHDFPKPASTKQSRPNSILRLLYPPAPPAREAIFDTFALVNSFGGLAATHSLDRTQTRRALRDAGIDIYEEVARDWDRGLSIQELSRRHGTGRDTIARWVRKTGRNINPRNGNRRYDEALITKTYGETNSVNKAAIAAKVSWATARSVLARYGVRAEMRSRPISVSGLRSEVVCQSSLHS